VALLGLARLATVAVLALAAGPAAADTRTAARFAASADGVRIAYEVRGKGTPAVVLVHGWSCDRTYWKSQVGPLSQKFTVVTVDLAGHGASGAGRETWSMASFGADVAAVVRKLDLPRVVLVGHSMGGDAIAEAARRLPGRVAGLVWVDTYKQLGTFRTPEQVQAIVGALRRDFAGTTRTMVHAMFARDADPALVERVTADMAQAPPAVALGALEAAISYDRLMPDTLKELNLPVAAINPEKPPSDAVALARYGVGVETMAGVGHFPMLEAPERFNALLTKTVEQMVR
jgi:pimeloyl-ACP methyl ester carboxylesterase